MRILGSIGGADLTKPEPTAKWMAGALVAVIILAAVVTVALWLFNKGKSMVTQAAGTVTGAASAGSTAFFGS